MTYPELQIQLDLNPDNRLDVLNNIDNTIDTCRWTAYGYLFVDSENGQCHLFDKNGQKDDISKVKTINDWTFYNCLSLTSIKIPSSIKRISYRAFYNCISLKSIKIPASVRSIGEGAFAGCKSLTHIKIPSSVKSIEDGAFAYCESLPIIKIPSNVESIEYGIFVNCKSLANVIFKDKTINQVKAMKYYPWGIKDKSIIKVES